MEYHKDTLCLLWRVLFSDTVITICNFPICKFPSKICPCQLYMKFNSDKTTGVFEQVGIYMFRVNNRDTRTRCEICSKLTIETLERRRVVLALIQASVLDFLEMKSNPTMPGVHKMVAIFLMCFLNILWMPSITELKLCCFIYTILSKCTTRKCH